jgi:hypothetical protein
MSNPINSNSTPPVTNGNPRHPDAQGGVSSPFAPRNLPFSQHPALDRGIAGNRSITNPTTPGPYDQTQPKR